MTGILETMAIKIAREAIAAKKEAEGAPNAAHLIRAGVWDDSSEVANARIGALAVISSPLARIGYLKPEDVDQLRRGLGDCHPIHGDTRHGYSVPVFVMPEPEQ
jgi:hypothetical protein